MITERDVTFNVLGNALHLNKLKMDVKRIYIKGFHIFIIFEL